MIDFQNVKKMNDLKVRDLRGKIKFLEEKTYSAIENSGKIEKGEFISCYFSSFNEDGNILVEVNDSALSLSKEIYVYDSNGNITENKSKDSYNNNYHCKYIFDIDNKITERYWYNDREDMEGKDNYIYDLNGYLLEINSYDSERSFKEKVIYQYDSNRKVAEEAHYDSDGILLWKYIYDLWGNPIEEIAYDSDGNIYQKESFKNKYNSKGKLIYSEFEINDILHRIFIYKYDSIGNEYRCIIYNSEKELICDRNYTEFDYKNNWIKYTEKFKDRLEITIRQIDYYY